MTSRAVSEDLTPDALATLRAAGGGGFLSSTLRWLWRERGGGSLIAFPHVELVQNGNSARK